MPWKLCAGTAAVLRAHETSFKLACALYLLIFHAMRYLCSVNAACSALSRQRGGWATVFWETPCGDFTFCLQAGSSDVDEL